jgi:predicted transposase YbfD/YdcC
VRRLAATNEVVPVLDWPDLAQVCRIERIREVAGKTSREIAYAVTSLAPTRATPADLLGLVRNHWLIENRLHWRRDTALAEDACRVRSGTAPQALAALRNAVLRIAHNHPGPLRAVRETFAENRADAIAAVTHRIL